VSPPTSRIAFATRSCSTSFTRDIGILPIFACAAAGQAKVAPSRGRSHLRATKTCGATVSVADHAHRPLLWASGRRGGLQPVLVTLAPPGAFARKQPAAERAWPWQWVFPSERTFRGRVTGGLYRHHIHETVIQRAVHMAVIQTGLGKRASCHTLRSGRLQSSRHARPAEAGAANFAVDQWIIEELRF
jgi:hypothetical protein